MATNISMRVSFVEQLIRETNNKLGGSFILKKLFQGRQEGWVIKRRLDFHSQELDLAWFGDFRSYFA